MHTSSNMSRWSTIQLKTRDSVRAQHHENIGVLMWDTMVIQSSYAGVYDVRMMSRALSFLAEDAVYSLAKHQLGLLRWHWGKMLHNDTCHKLPPVPIKRFVVAFSDASLTHM